ncbi:hypothetical protein AB833_27410 [Chromatiales bacterium (ex Bugula neritina AB1)]|nr:hypothetical protein AB833_27410 [Chromatiales bacterium (ex Bugula neritina AB1)]
MNSLPKNQQGATLFIALIMLVIISLLGVTALKNASIEEQMSSNLYQKNITFQASESAVESTINNASLISQVLTSTTPINQTVSVPIPNATANVTYTSTGVGPSIGNSQQFGGQRIMITSTGQIAAVNARTVTIHGIVRTVPNLGN